MQNWPATALDLLALVCLTVLLSLHAIPIEAGLGIFGMIVGARAALSLPPGGPKGPGAAGGGALMALAAGFAGALAPAARLAREYVATRVQLARFAVAGLALLVGCAASPRDLAVTAVNAGADLGTESEKIIESLDRAEQAAALDQLPAAEVKPAVAEIRARYHKAFVAYRDYRAAWLAEAAFVRAYDASVAVGGLPDNVKLIALQQSMAQAAGALSAAVFQIRGGK